MTNRSTRTGRHGCNSSFHHSLIIILPPFINGHVKGCKMLGWYRKVTTLHVVPRISMSPFLSTPSTKRGQRGEVNASKSKQQVDLLLCQISWKHRTRVYLHSSLLEALTSRIAAWVFWSSLTFWSCCSFKPWSSLFSSSSISRTCFSSSEMKEIQGYYRGEPRESQRTLPRSHSQYLKRREDQNAAVMYN